MISYKVEWTKQFKKSYKKICKQGYESKVDSIIQRLANNESLEEKYKDHALKGKYQGYRECHIMPNLLLVYKKLDDVLVLVCVDVGSHSEVF